MNCQWSSWSRYSECTKSCGGGTQFKTRIKTIPESDGGTCFGDKVYSRNCNMQNCPGKFIKVEYMFLLTGNIMSGAEKLWGLQNIFFHVVYKPCIISVNCQWSSWSRYSGCTKSCGGGTQFTKRTKTIQESDGGTCSGEKVYSRNCNIQSCEGKFTKVEYMFLLTENMPGAEKLRFFGTSADFLVVTASTVKRSDLFFWIF